jgi:hypothetical protein
MPMPLIMESNKPQKAAAGHRRVVIATSLKASPPKNFPPGKRSAAEGDVYKIEHRGLGAYGDIPRCAFKCHASINCGCSHFYSQDCETPDGAALTRPCSQKMSPRQYYVAGKFVQDAFRIHVKAHGEFRRIVAFGRIFLLGTRPSIQTQGGGSIPGSPVLDS